MSAPAPEQRVLHGHQRPVQGRVVAFVEGGQPLHREAQRHLQVVVQVGADARPVELHVYAELAQVRAGADPRQHQKLRRADRAARQDHLAARAGRVARAVDPIVDTHRPAALQPHALGQHTRLQRQVGPGERRAQERLGRLETHPAPLVHVQRPDAFDLAAVEVRRRPDAGLHSRPLHGVQYGPADPGRIDAQLAAGAVRGVGAGAEVLVRLEVGQHVVPAPAFEPELAPLVEIGGVPAHVDHAVDGR